MPRTMHVYVPGTGLLNRLRTMGFANATTTLARIEIRPNKPVRVWVNQGGSQGTGTQITTDDVLTFLRQRGIVPPDIGDVLALYIDTPRDMTPEDVAQTLQLAGILTSSALTTQFVNALSGAVVVA